MLQASLSDHITAIIFLFAVLPKAHYQLNTNDKWHAGGKHPWPFLTTIKTTIIIICLCVLFQSEHMAHYMKTPKSKQIIKVKMKRLARWTNSNYNNSTHTHANTHTHTHTCKHAHTHNCGIITEGWEGVGWPDLKKPSDQVCSCIQRKDRMEISEDEFCLWVDLELFWLQILWFKGKEIKKIKQLYQPVLSWDVKGKVIWERTRPCIGQSCQERLKEM